MIIIPATILLHCFYEDIFFFYYYYFRSSSRSQFYQVEINKGKKKEKRRPSL